MDDIAIKKQKVLILETDRILNNEHLQRIREDIIAQINSGLLIVPPDFTCRIVDRDCLMVKEDNA